MFSIFSAARPSAAAALALLAAALFHSPSALAQDAAEALPKLSESEFANVSPFIKKALASYAAGKPEEALTHFMTAAETGNADGQFGAGFVIMATAGESADRFQRGVDWMRKAAAGGSAPAGRYLGTMYASGQGVKQDFAMARSFLEKAAATGDGTALYRLGLLAASGNGYEKPEPEKAAEYFGKAAEWQPGGDPQSRTMAQSTGDIAEAKKWYERDRRRGSRLPVFLGGIFELGLGGEKPDAERAVFLYREAALQGHPPSQNKLGVAYENGVGGLKKDEKAAAEWYRKAADQGFAPAMYSLGVLHQQGRGVAKADTDAAARWFKMSALAGFPRAQDELGMRYRHGAGVPQDDVAALAWFERAAAQGYAPAQTNLARMLEMGITVPPNFLRAAEFYTAAARQVPARACFLASMLVSGIGTDRNPVAAYVLLNAAKDQYPPAAEALEKLKPSMSADEIKKAEEEIAKAKSTEK
ncbi:MAG: SEL1-like repeat protein [Verrucomicrobiales bacterium]